MTRINTKDFSILLLCCRSLGYAFHPELLMKQKALYQFVAVLLLVCALSDIALCNPCIDELSTSDDVSVSFSDSSSPVRDGFESNNDITIVSADLSKNSENHRTSCIDCFCCVHVLPSEAVPFDYDFERQVPIDRAINFLPSSPPRDTYHPPRFA